MTRCLVQRYGPASEHRYLVWVHSEGIAAEVENEAEEMTLEQTIRNRIVTPPEAANGKLEELNLV